MIGSLLSALVSVALVAVGGAALAAPRVSSSQYGIAVDDRRSLALIRGMGIRDMALGALLALLVLEDAREALAWAMPVLALLALVDLGLVLAERRGERGFDLSCAMHAAGAIACGVIGMVLRRGG
jgi:hypothetical protein